MNHIFQRIKTQHVIILITAIVAVNYFFFGYLDHRITKLEGDETEYNDYATNIVQKGIYSLDGQTFSAWREPGYILFISSVYAVSGVGNIRAVQIAQALLVLGTALLIYFIFVRQKQPELGAISSIMIAANPYFGHMAARLLPEIFFTFLSAGVFYMILSILGSSSPIPSRLACLGLAMGALALTRLHFLYFPPALIGMSYIWRKRFSILTGKNALMLLIAFAVPLMLWGLYCLGQSGKFMLQESRVEIQLFVRAQRVQESWPKLISYAGSQIKETFSGKTDPVLQQKDYRSVLQAYKPDLSSKSDSIRLILHSPVKYLLGDFTEFLKLISIYHAYAAPHFSKYLRVAVYIALYGIFAWGLFVCWKKRKIPDIIAIAMMFLIYNALIISLFNAEPRYNVPFFIFYITTGVAGIAMHKMGRSSPSR